MTCENCLALKAENERSKEKYEDKIDACICDYETLESENKSLRSKIKELEGKLGDKNGL